MIDNGNHLLLSGNHAALDYLATIGAADRLVGPDEAAFAFIDLKTGERWMVRINDGVRPVVAVRPRAPARHAREPNSSAAQARCARPASRSGEVIECTGPAYRELPGGR